MSFPCILRAHLCGRQPELELLWHQPGFAELNALAQKLHCPVRFAERPVKHALEYQAWISRHREVPTRIDSWHDRLNAAMWILWPRTKLALNAAHLRAGFSGHARTRYGDGLTLIDEVGIVVVASHSMAVLNRRHAWKSLFWARRDAWHATALPLVIGHGLAEQLLQPYLGLTAKALYIDGPRPKGPEAKNRGSSRGCEVDPGVGLGVGSGVNLEANRGWEQALDRLVARQIEDSLRFSRPQELCPFPILGLPGWWPGNDSEAFYENRSYFRPPPKR